MPTTYTRLHNLSPTCSPLHDETFLEISVPLKIETEHGIVHHLNFRHVIGRKRNLDDQIDIWIVETYAPLQPGKREEEGKEYLGIFTADYEDRPIENAQVYARLLWCTLHWYFHLPATKWPKSAGPGAPTSEREIDIVTEFKEQQGRYARKHQEYLYEMEQLGLVSCSSSCASRFSSGEKDKNGDRKHDRFFIKEKTFWQIPFEVVYCNPREQEAKLSIMPVPKPLDFVQSGISRHPRRPKPPRPGQTFYKRYIPSLESFLTFRTADLEVDVQILHEWMNVPRVNYFWGEGGLISHQESYLIQGLDNEHYFPVIASWKKLSFQYNKKTGELNYESLKGHKGEEPFGYFEIYWAKEDKLAAYTDIGDWDRGIHVLVGEEKFRGPHRVPVWLSSLVHYMLLSDPRTQTLILEPRIDNEKFINYLINAGFYKEKNFSFPHKQAVVMKMKREGWNGPEC